MECLSKNASNAFHWIRRVIETSSNGHGRAANFCDICWTNRRAKTACVYSMLVFMHVSAIHVMCTSIFATTKKYGIRRREIDLLPSTACFSWLTAAFTFTSVSIMCHANKHYAISLLACTWIAETFYCNWLVTAQCTLVHMRGLGIACRPSVRPSVCNVGGLWSHRLEILETNYTDN